MTEQTPAPQGQPQQPAERITIGGEVPGAQDRPAPQSDDRLAEAVVRAMDARDARDRDAAQRAEYDAWRAKRRQGSREASGFKPWMLFAALAIVGLFAIGAYYADQQKTQLASSEPTARELNQALPAQGTYKPAPQPSKLVTGLNADQVYLDKSKPCTQKSTGKAGFEGVYGGKKGCIVKE
jgi:hypothetical protein